MLNMKMQFNNPKYENKQYKWSRARCRIQSVAECGLNWLHMTKPDVSLSLLDLDAPGCTNTNLRTTALVVETECHLGVRVHRRHFVEQPERATSAAPFSLPQDRHSTEEHEGVDGGSRE
jgi:hypothetical protein